MTILKRFFWALALGAAPAFADVQVNALFEGSAYVVVDGQQKLLREGQSLGSLRLIDANPRRAIVEILGERQELTLSSRINANYRELAVREVVIHRDRQRKYNTHATINGRNITALVDTGANVLAMSARHAQQLGIAYKQGSRAAVSTASGVAEAYQVVLESVSVGGIVARKVPAVVIAGNYPEQVLLGMSYLEHVDMQEQDNILTLRARY